MSARGYCTDCENWTETRNGRCSCGSGRVLTPPAGYRILGPNELDPVTVDYSDLIEGLELASAEVGRAKAQDAIERAITIFKAALEKEREG